MERVQDVADRIRVHVDLHGADTDLEDVVVEVRALDNLMERLQDRLDLLGIHLLVEHDLEGVDHVVKPDALAAIGDHGAIITDVDCLGAVERAVHVLSLHHFLAIIEV